MESLVSSQPTRQMVNRSQSCFPFPHAQVFQERSARSTISHRCLRHVNLSMRLLVPCMLRCCNYSCNFHCGKSNCAFVSFRNVLQEARHWCEVPYIPLFMSLPSCWEITQPLYNKQPRPMQPCKTPAKHPPSPTRC